MDRGKTRKSFFGRKIFVLFLTIVAKLITGFTSLFSNQLLFFFLGGAYLKWSFQNEVTSSLISPNTFLQIPILQSKPAVQNIFSCGPYSHELNLYERVSRDSS
jgi:hypothetical protein